MQSIVNRRGQPSIVDRIIAGAYIVKPAAKPALYEE